MKALFLEKITDFCFCTIQYFPAGSRAFIVEYDDENNFCFSSKEVEDDCEKPSKSC